MIEVRRVSRSEAVDHKRAGNSDPLEFEVTIRDAKSQSRHQVTIGKAACDRLGGGVHTPEHVLEASFRFLLDREPKESILGRFDISVIGKYFPEFERELPGYL